jgi:SulP family sulfate permease
MLLASRNPCGYWLGLAVYLPALTQSPKSAYWRQTMSRDHVSGWQIARIRRLWSLDDLQSRAKALGQGYTSRVLSHLSLSHLIHRVHPMTINPMNMSLDKLLAGLSAGLVLAIVEIFSEVSFGSLLFAGELREFLGLAIGLCLAGSFIYGLFAVLMSSSQNNIAVVQDAPVAILAIMLAEMMSQLETATASEKLATALATIVLTSAMAGVGFWLLGRFNLGRLVRFIPYPVVGGFLAGTGFLVLVGGISVMAEAPLTLDLLQWDSLVRWLPGFVYGVLLLGLLTRFTQFWVMPSLLVAGYGLFYAVTFLVGGDVTSAAAEGWLVGPFPEGRLWQPVVTSAITQANWPLVFANGLAASSVILISAISLLLNISGLEVISHEDIDINRELKWSGLANLAGAVAVCPVGFTALSFSALGYRLGGRTRLVGICETTIIGVTVLFGAAMLSSFPRMVAGGLLVFLGLSFLMEWLYDTWFKLPKLDYVLIWLILIAIATLGFLPGVALGLGIATLFFLISYSQINVIRQATTRADYRSTVVRSLLYEQLLEQRGQQVWILTLQGYLFFGTAHRLIGQITDRLTDASLPPLRFLVVDFSLVTGMDSSAIFSLERLQQSTGSAEVQVILTGVKATLEKQMQPILLTADDVVGQPSWRILATQAEGVTWVEEQMLTTFQAVGLVGTPRTFLASIEKRFKAAAPPIDWLDNLHPLKPPAPSSDLEQLMAYFQKIDFQPGDTLLQEGNPVDGLYCLEQGKATYPIFQAEQNRWETVTLETGTVLENRAFYANYPCPHPITAASHGVLYSLTRDALATMESQHPHLAIILHRTLIEYISSSHY